MHTLITESRSSSFSSAVASAYSAAGAAGRETIDSALCARRKSTAVRRYGSVDCCFLLFSVVGAYPCSQQNCMASIIFA